MKDKGQAITFCGVCIFLFCYFLRIFNMPNELTVVLGGLLCLILAIQQKKFKIDLGICLLAVALISYYVIINGINALLYSIVYIPLIIYELGNYVIHSFGEKDGTENTMLLLISIMVIGYSIHGLLNSYMWYGGYAVPGTRRWPDFWEKGIVPGTQHAAYFMPAMALFVPAVVYFKKRKISSLIFILLTMFFGYTALATRSRMSVLIFAIVVCLQLVRYVISEKEVVKMQLRNKRFRIVLGAVFVAMIIIIFLLKDTPVIVAFVKNMSKGGGILNNARFHAQRLALHQLFDYPMGGYLMELGEISHAHNIWLDMANAAGLISFFAFVLYTMYTVYELVWFIAENKFNTETQLIVIGIYISFFMFFTVEPALEASIHLITPWIFLNGLIHGMLSKRKNS